MADGQVTWTVVDQREESRDPGDGIYTTGVVVRFRTGSGQLGTIFVPDRDYTAARVRDMIRRRAAEIEAVQELTEA